MPVERSIERILTTQIKLRQLVLLKAVADSGSISKAAELLHMSQPAVSKTIRELEVLLGETLFERTVKGVEPTEFGQYFIRYARSMHAESRRAAEELTALKQGAGGTLVIGSYMVALPQLLPHALSIFYMRNDLARVTVFDGNKDKLLAGLIEGEIDVVVGRMSDVGAINQINPLNQTPLYFEPIVLVAGVQNPLAAQASVTPADLQQQEWVMPHASSVVRAPINLFFIREGLKPPKRVIETVSFPLIRALLMQRNIVAALPLQIVAADIRQSLLVRLPIDMGYPALPVGIITNAAIGLSNRTATMIECLKRAAAELYHSPADELVRGAA
ncbi:MAG: LysR substrate-binding domain-containing protein [Janthinobacterium lividum]